MKLNTDTVDVASTRDGVVVEPSYLGYLRSHGYGINAVNDVRLVPSESRDIAHVVMEIETTDKPPEHPQSDVVADKTELRVCSCEDWTYNQSIDVSKRSIADGSFGMCRHLRAAFKTERAKADPEQDTL